MFEDSICATCITHHTILTFQYILFVLWLFCVDQSVARINIRRSVQMKFSQREAVTTCGQNKQSVFVLFVFVFLYFWNEILSKGGCDHSRTKETICIWIVWVWVCIFVFLECNSHKEMLWPLEDKTNKTFQMPEIPSHSISLFQIDMEKEISRGKREI